MRSTKSLENSGTSKKGPITFQPLSEGLGFHFPTHGNITENILSQKSQEKLKNALSSHPLTQNMPASIQKSPISQNFSLLDQPIPRIQHASPPLDGSAQHQIIPVQKTFIRNMGSILLRCSAFLLDTCLNFAIYLGIGIGFFWTEVWSFQASDFFLTKNIFYFFFVFCIFHAILLVLQQRFLKTSIGKFLFQT